MRNLRPSIALRSAQGEEGLGRSQMLLILSGASRASAVEARTKAQSEL